GARHPLPHDLPAAPGAAAADPVRRPSPGLDPHVVVRGAAAPRGGGAHAPAGLRPRLAGDPLGDRSADRGPPDQGPGRGRRTRLGRARRGGVRDDLCPGISDHSARTACATSHSSVAWWVHPTPDREVPPCPVRPDALSCAPPAPLPLRPPSPPPSPGLPPPRPRGPAP